MLKLLVDDSILGIVPSGDGQPLVSSSFPNDDLSISWTPTQKAAANAFVIQKLGIDLSVDDALWQTAHLVAANPRIRRFDVRLETDASDRHDSGLLLRTVIRSDTSFDKLYLQVLEHRDTGWLLLFDGPLTAADQRVAISAVTIDEVQWSVREQNGRLLQFGGPATFIRSIRMAMRVVGARRTVHVPALRRRAEDTFTVDASGSPQLSVIGEERPQDGAALMRGIRRRVAMKRAADALEQMWFDGGADEAAPTIRRLVSRVQTRAMFIDPYVGPMEMARFVSAIPNHSAKIQVLGSMEGIRSGKTSAPEGGVLIALNALEDRTVELKDKLTMRNLEVRLMKGKRADVHDRFIVCDDQVWTLGSSLNEFGSRGTMLLRVPHPELILQRLDRAWSKAVATTEKIKLYQAALSEGKERPDNEDDDADDAAVDIAEKP
jgi:hypothetical protein